MIYNLITSIQECFLLRAEAPLGAVLYSHLATSVVALFLGIFVFIKGPKILINRLLVLISLVFFVWSMLDLITWEVGYNSIYTMISWSLLGIFTAILSMLSIYITYVFIEKIDMSFTKKLFLLIPILPVLIFTPTTYNLSNFIIPNVCEPTEGKLFTTYYYYLGLLAFVVILFMVLNKLRKVEKKEWRPIILFSLGIELFIASFFFCWLFSQLP